ncbi:hypothetical protein AAFF_G00206820, partial [Aldrovandia affinis]
ELQKVNDRSVSGMMSTVTASFQSIKDLVHSSMAKCHAGMMEQETLCGETKRTLLVRTASLLLWALLSTVLWHKISENYAPACTE